MSNKSDWNSNQYMKFAADGTIILKMPRVFFTATKKQT